ARDAWFIGFSADYVAGVWIGHDDNSPLSGVTGGSLPAEIWRETMVRVHDKLEAQPLPMLRPSEIRPKPLPLAQDPSTLEGRIPLTKGTKNRSLRQFLQSLFGPD
ncbi:MAG: glycosyl transferase, partial [Paracoccaceae bacterium]|nr:glycosyl transferase [Paracoccaceae bacterium]